MKHYIIYSLVTLGFLISCNKPQKAIAEKQYSKTMLDIDKYNSPKQLIYDTPTYDRLMADPNIHTDNINRYELCKKHPSCDFDTLSYTLTDTLLQVSSISIISGSGDKAVLYKKTRDSIILNERYLYTVDTASFKEDPKILYLNIVELVTYMETKTTLKLDSSDKNKVIVYEGKRLR